ncbi:cyclic peptide export ABC transporter (plasmid) [Skermanella sp. TT6]|uniref:Cyclic peptide export ABC transporter n=1 Tax=Skermanella cutis TaxID=2775420 RepID=A0ABX7BKP1_9PROT|nr:cyclic peptide export ABC transporter [Skermanella sp. TT6]QQP93602.1 cyclic peptide export ABC transporter [Skermanella sp. TT6]
MTFIRLVLRESRSSPYKVAVMAMLAGLGNAMILAIINRSADLANDGGAQVADMILFAATMGIQVLAQRYVSRTTTREVEEIIHRLRKRLISLIRQTDLTALEGIGRSEIYAMITKETQAISSSVPMLVNGCQSGILLVFTLAYIYVLSSTAFMLTIAITAIAASTHLARIGQLRREVELSFQLENQLFERLTDLLSGYKEVKLNIRRSRELQEHFDEVSSASTEAKVKTQIGISNEFLFAQSIFYLMLAAMVFVVPALSPTFSDVALKTSAAVLFLIGPITSLVQAIPAITMANAATDNIERLSKTLSERIDPTATDDEVESFARIEFQDVTFSYVDPRYGTRFSVGPFNVDVNRGEMVFITGGNGAGKSTFLKLFTGLYRPDGGRILLDGKQLDQRRHGAYRSLISAVFTDYHLFRRLYGLPEADVSSLLRQMEIDHKVSMTGRDFDSLDFSAGQKKRLALIVALLEDRPIIVLDEWAADQDPIFRRKFYEELLPAFKAMGKTVVAVTHDDRYFGLADRRLHMEEGRFAPEGHDSGSHAPDQGDHA